MKEYINRFLNYKKLSIILFFSVLLIVGILIFDDYGISWDEYNHRVNGFVSLNYIRSLLSLNTYSGFPNLENYIAREYGVIFDLPMAYLEKLLLIEDSKNYFLMRHLTNFFIFFISCICFYLLLIKRFTYKLSMLGLFFFVLSPRIFADSFYNMKDSVFLSLFVISLYFSIIFLNKISYKSAFIASLLCSIVIGSRVLGIIIPFIVAIFFIFESLDNKKYFNKNILKIVFFIFLCIAFTVIFWPYLWSDPLVNFVSTFKGMSTYPWRGSVFYFGKYISAVNLPWHYPLVWIFITTPLLYLFLFISGTSLIVIRTIKTFLNLNEKNNTQNLWKDKNERLDIIMFIIFYFTIFLVIKINSTLYGGWRHLYFIYPSLIFISVVGLEFLSKRFNHKYLLILIFPFLLNTAYWMIKNHPFQFVYFNTLAGKNINNNFELDYWGVSNKHSLEYILINDSNKKIKLFVASASPYGYTLEMFDKKDKKRIEFVNNVTNADYLVTNHYYQNGNPKILNYNFKNNYNLVKEFKINNMPINSVYKIK